MALAIDLAELATEIKEAAIQDRSEDSVKLAVEPILRRRILEPLGINIIPRYQFTLLSGTRPDALYGHVVIDYKRADLLSSAAERTKAVKQVRGYIAELAGSAEEYPKYLGVLIDGYSVMFIRYRRDNWDERGPLKINDEVMSRLVEALRGLSRKPLDVTFMVQDFGPNSQTTRTLVPLLYRKLKSPLKRRTVDLFEDWKRVFMQVVSYSPKKVRGLKDFYGMEGEIDAFKLFFAIHTFYALIMKLVAAEVAVLYSGGRLVQSYIAELEDASTRSQSALKDKLTEVENGELFKQFLRVENFIEADYFTWYLNEWDSNIAAGISGLIQRLAEYEAGTAELEPEYVKDLFKGLYQNLVPKPIRHDLGEYFTPDWLAELVLQRSSLTAEKLEEMAKEKENPLNLRILDPACGSGTFLVQVIKQLRAYCDEHYVDRRRVLEAITRNIVGFDLNPLAYIAGRVNYLLALGDLLRGASPGIQIPVYLADSIMIQTRTTLEGEFYILGTSVGEFAIPTSLAERNILDRILAVVDSCLRVDYPINDFIGRVRNEFGDVTQVEIKALHALYSLLVNLEEQDRNRIWTGLIKNSFAPLFMQKFDFIIGNPPWISWESLPAGYRDVSESLWKKHGLLATDRSRGMGRTKRDLAMLFVAVSLDRYLSADGILCFLLPYTLFKSQAASGFRRQIAFKSRVVTIDDLVELTPFEGAVNRTSLLLLKRGKTKFPIPCNSWMRTADGHFDFDSAISAVVDSTRQYPMVMEPIQGLGTPESPWLLARAEAVPAIKKVLGRSPYESHKGVNFNLNGGFWVHILEQRNGNLLIKNLGEEVGRLTVDNIPIAQVTREVEREFVFPLIRGRDVSKWSANPSAYVVLPVDEKGETIPVEQMRKRFPKTYEYLYGFFKYMIGRGGEPYKTNLKPYHKMTISKAEKEAPPFYYIFNASAGRGKYKVSWKEISGKISGKAKLVAAVIEPKKDKFLGFKIPIPDHKTYLVPFKEELEAHFVVALLNSTPVRLAVSSFMIETAISTQVLRSIRVPRFDKESGQHVKLAELSRKAHEIASSGRLDGLKEIEDRIDGVVADLYGITPREMKATKQSLAILEPKEQEENSDEDKEDDSENDAP